LKLLLDAMFNPEIARQLRQRGHDVIAATERRDLADLLDPELLAAAQTEERAILTNDPGGFLELDLLYRQQSRAHYGVILTSDRRFDRNTERSIGQLVLVLDAFLRTQPPEPGATSLVHWLR
jgi:predicted nuclease of predicted toxin-antitoxin system